MANEKRLIDANEFLKALNERPLDFLDVGGDFGYFDETIDSVVNEQPTVDAVEVVHGRWEWYADRCEDLFLGCDDDYGWRCSKCKVPLDDEDDPEVMPTFRYCPHCGAKMDGGNEDV